MTLTATLHLLSSPLLSLNQKTGASKRNGFVYLMTTSYLKNWLAWAAHQTVAPDETERLEQAIRMAANAYGFQKLATAASLSAIEYENPGPIDATDLSESMDHPRRLRPDVVVQHPAPHVDNNVNTVGISPKTAASSASSYAVCAVPENFYEVCFPLCP
jgi:hypothetical protein